MNDNNFWQALDTLITTSELIIDRAQGSMHPRYPTFYYSLDYGYLKDTRTGDGDGIDVWVGSLAEKKVTGVVFTVDLFKRDSEIKILLGCTQEEMQKIEVIHQNGMQSAMLVGRGCSSLFCVEAWVKGTHGLVNGAPTSTQKMKHTRWTIAQ